MLKLNVGCGANKLTGYVNVDIVKELNPDLIFDFTRTWPFADHTVDEVFMSHVIEHVAKEIHLSIFREAARVLKPEGQFILTYPEFSKCYENWAADYRGMREFWEKTILGRGTTLYDCHRALMDTVEVTRLLTSAGFEIVTHFPEPNEPYNSVVVSKYVGVLTYEDNLRRLMNERNN
jgi:predicted SAM-dependent methyltransferase